jgi:glycosyltransferase involved in cell wall biosynthesis
LPHKDFTIVQPGYKPKVRVVVQQQLLPPYRIPFFTELGRRVDLTVALAANVEISGATTVPQTFQGETFRVAWFDQHTFLGRTHQKGLMEYLVSVTPDVLVAGSGYLPYYFWHLPTLVKLRRMGVRLFTWGCDGYEFQRKEDWDRFRSVTLRRRIHQWYLGTQYRNCLHGFIGYSQHTAEFWKYAFDIPADRISVAENALDTSAMENEHKNVQSGQTKKNLGQVIFVGRLIESKRVDLLLRAFARARVKATAPGLLIVGDGPARSSLESLSESLSPAGSVKFTGNVSDKQSLARLLAGSGCFILPGYGGLAINEAMAAGLAIVCSRGDGTEKHLVRNGENGYLIPWADESAMTETITGLLADPERTLRMGELSYQLITQSFTLKNMVDKYVQALVSGIGMMESA